MIEPVDIETLSKLLEDTINDCNDLELPWVKKLLSSRTFKQCIADATEIAEEAKEPLMVYALLFVHGMKVEDLILKDPQ